MEEKDYFSKICLCRLILVQTAAMRVAALFLIQGRETISQRKIYALLLDQERAKTLPAAVHSQLPSA